MEEKDKKTNQNKEDKQKENKTSPEVKAVNKEADKAKVEAKATSKEENKAKKETDKTKTEAKATNKDENKAKTKVKKEKKSKKWIILVVLLVILIILAVLVLYTSITPRDSVNNLFTNLKNGNKFMASLNIDYDNLISVLDSTIVQQNGSEMSNLERECFNELSWEITGESVENNTATVTATVTTKSFRQVLLNWIEKISEVLENQDDISTEQNLQLLEESLTEEDVGTTQTEVTINLERKGFTWKVIIDEDFIDAIFPGLNQVLDVMEQLSNEISETNQ